MKSRGLAKTSEQVSVEPSCGSRSSVWDCLLVCFVFLWPAIYLLRNLIPFGGTYTAIENDFGGLYYPYKAYLLAALGEGRIPLWAPSEAAGFPFFSNPFAQVFYPLNSLLFLYYKIVGSYTLLDHQYYTVLGLCIFALGLYFWLRLLNCNLRAVIFATLIMSVSFKMTEMVRLPNAVHTAAWYPWILFAITKLFYASTRRTWLMSLALFFFAVCLLTAGYPYYIYYAIFLIPVYIVLLAAGPLRRRMLPNPDIRWKRGLLFSTLAGGLACILCSPYLMAIRSLLEQTTDRGGKNFEYSTAYIFNIEDTVGSLIYPPLAQTEGWYFFSITALLMVLVYILGFLGFRNRAAGPAPCAEPCQKPHGMIVLLIWIAVISYISYGKDSALFKLLWNTMPGFSSLRVWGRLNVILVPLLAWLLSMAYSHFENRLFAANQAAGNKLKIFFWLIVSYAVIFLAQYHFYESGEIDGYWRYFPHLSGYPMYFIIWGLAGFFTLTIVLLFSRAICKWTHGQPMIAALLFLLASAEMWPVGANTWVVKNAAVPVRNPISISRNNTESFTRPRVTYHGVITLAPDFGVGIIRNWDFSRYTYFLQKTQNELKNRNILLGVNAQPKRIFISQSIDYPTVQAFLNDSQRFQDTGKIVSYTGDVLVWECDMPVDGYLSFIDNWDPYWKAYVDGKESLIGLLFGTFKSVSLNKGNHRVEFRYEPTLKRVLFGTAD